MLVLAAAVFTAAVYFLASGLTAHRREVALALRRAGRYGGASQRETEMRRSVNERVLAPLIGRLAALAMRFTPHSSPEAIRERLMLAGLSRSMSPQAYLALKGAVVCAAGGAGVVAAASGTMPRMLGVTIGLGCGALGFLAPDRFIDSRIRGRRDQMRAELPDVLDLLCVSVEAGLGFDQALAKLNERMTGPLVDEFALVLHAMRIGETRSAALKHMSDRLEIAEISQFTRALIQADQLGIALSRILRVQSQDMRTRRQLAAEEKAMKAPVKMLFPTVIFIFPALFVVALGPAVISLLKSFAS